MFSAVLGLTSIGYSEQLKTNVVVFEVELTFDDTGHYEVGPGLLFWRDGAPVARTSDSADATEWKALAALEK